YYKTISGPLGKGLLKKLEPKGIIGLAYWDNGFHMVSANKPLLMPADFQGLKIRISGSKIADLYFRKLGALPQIMAFSEVYQALQTGVVDGTENTPSNIYTQKMHEVQKHLTVSDHGYIGYAVITNKKFWDGLPPDIRSALEGAMKDATRYANAIAQQENDKALDDIRKAGSTTIYTLTAEQKAAWRKAFLPVQKEMASRLGAELISEVNKEAAALGYK
ncbi:MAG TPA: DctP family TRAP transporter solute-binding subunit, partial [Burkholderiaceae bacterium]|nr:DctP family TRAP transporter solute-binding subunit [Burkholderiaceae bacterium]